MAPLGDEPLFNSFFERRGEMDRQTAGARAILADWKGPDALVVVTHQVNITQLTGETLSSGEGLVVRVPPGKGPVEILGRIP